MVDDIGTKRGYKDPISSLQETDIEAVFEGLHRVEKNETVFNDNIQSTNTTLLTQNRLNFSSAGDWRSLNSMAMYVNI